MKYGLHIYSKKIEFIIHLDQEYIWIWEEVSCAKIMDYPDKCGVFWNMILGCKIRRMALDIFETKPRAIMLTQVLT